MIAGFVGANGSGKTLAAVEAALKISKRFPKRTILSTVPLEVPQYEQLTSWQQIVKAEPPFILLLDEVAALADSRSTLTLPPHIILYIGSLRHRDVVCFWTAPAWNWCDVRLRAVTTEAHEMTPVWARRRRDLAWKQTLFAMKNSRPTNNEQGDALPPRKGLPVLKFLPASKAYGVFPTRRDPMAISEFARICPACGLPKRRRESYCQGHEQVRREKGHRALLDHAEKSMGDLRHRIGDVTAENILADLDHLAQQTPGITSIAASSASEVLTVQRPTETSPAPHTSGEDVPPPPAQLALDGQDVTQ